ncbi:MAG: N-succinylarginine dihydrolase [Candidatus Margulisiibacteriota bacterium]
MIKQVFIDCMPGPTYHFGGHAFGNRLSMQSKGKKVNPKQAALEWLNKVTYIYNIGAIQLVLPPHPKPHQINKNLTKADLSCGFIWMANAGHFIPKVDTKSNTNHFIPSNMEKTVHRKNEHYFNRFWLKKICPSTQIHPPCLHPDEGAANTIRLWSDNSKSTITIFIYGGKTKRYPSRQSKKSIHEIIKKTNIINISALKQKANSIDQGVFHNDLISFGFKNKLFCHENAFENQKKQLRIIKKQFHNLTNDVLDIIEIKSSEISIKNTIMSYLFNSQAILINDKVHLLCPYEAKENIESYKLIRQWETQKHIDKAHFIELKSSLMNGGGPACLRLTLYLNNNELNQIPKQFLLNEKKIKDLKKIIIKHYPEKEIAITNKHKLNEVRKLNKYLNNLFLNTI